MRKIYICVILFSHFLDPSVPFLEQQSLKGYKASERTIMMSCLSITSPPPLTKHHVGYSEGCKDPCPSERDSSMSEQHRYMKS